MDAVVDGSLSLSVDSRRTGELFGAHKERDDDGEQLGCEDSCRARTEQRGLADHKEFDDGNHNSHCGTCPDIPSSHPGILHFCYRRFGLRLLPANVPVLNRPWTQREARCSHCGSEETSENDGNDEEKIRHEVNKAIRVTSVTTLRPRQRRGKRESARKENSEATANREFLGANSIFPAWVHDLDGFVDLQHHLHVGDYRKHLSHRRQINEHESNHGSSTAKRSNQQLRAHGEELIEYYDGLLREECAVEQAAE